MLYWPIRYTQIFFPGNSPEITIFLFGLVHLPMSLIEFLIGRHHIYVEYSHVGFAQ